jgi:hypothetical protein
MTSCGTLTHIGQVYDAGPDPRNGHSIYFTAMSARGDPITFTGGPAFGGMMIGNTLTCAVCHGSDGQGGTYYVHMQQITTPAISYNALVKMKQDAFNGTPQPAGYTFEDFRGEVVGGRDVDGSPLDQTMPHWNMSDADLQDLFAFLKTLK